ncbi:PASTA domain-containing protein [Nonomuraea sp. NPDC050328]|uniref:protein kinase domain-containing protein n=1 Tax=Nonomuraea sp. NPDC050328 TaxID=3364361 RepID=UPI0037BD17BC
MPIAQPLRTGDPQRLGDYELSGRLGEGGQGVVYLGGLDGETYAVKLLHGEVGEERAAFLREVELAKHVARFCTAQVIDVGFEDGRPYIVNEYVDGPSLHREVTLTGPRGGASLERLAVGCATALAAIHRAGIVHRDFKPQNVLLGMDGPRVIDFGLARALDAAATQSGRGVGTPAYMAPEQITASAVSGVADVFAWGATMCFAANASAPFGQDSVAPVLHRILTAPPALGRLEGRMRELVSACLEKDPRNRPTSRELLLALLGGSDGAPAEVLRSPPPPPVFRPADGLSRIGTPPGAEDSRGSLRPMATPEATGAASVAHAYHLPPDGPTLPPAPREARWAAMRRVGLATGAALLVSGAVLAGVLIPVLDRSGRQTVVAGPAAAPSTAPATPAEGLLPQLDRTTSDEEIPPPSPQVRPSQGGPGKQTTVRDVAIPRLIGLDRSAAQKALRAAGLQLGAVAEVSSPRKVGEVLGSVPSAGAKVMRGTQVGLTVSAGVTVPRLAGLSRKAAEAAILKAGLAVGKVSTTCSAGARGVVSAKPAAGTRVAAGTAVSFVVGRDGLLVPGVTGQARGPARKALVAAGFAVRVQGRLVTEPAQEDVVLGQNVAAGTCAQPGRVVVLTVGVLGQTEPDPDPEPSPEPSATPTD